MDGVKKKYPLKTNSFFLLECHFRLDAELTIPFCSQVIQKFIYTAYIAFFEHLSFTLILVRNVSRRLKIGRNMEKRPNLKSCRF